MKIACICNLNQTEYVIARYLRDWGHDVTLFLVNEYKHFMPMADTCGVIENIQVEELNMGENDSILDKKAKIELNKLQGFEVYFGSEVAPALMARLGMKLDFYIPIGTDLTVYPFYKLNQIPFLWQFKKWAFSKLQNRGIAFAKYIFLVKNGDLYYEESLKKIGFRGIRNEQSLPLLYPAEYTKAREETEIERQIKALKKQGNKLIISASRVEFTNPDSEHYKGTDILLKAISELKNAGNTNFILILPEYGSDVMIAKKRASHLQIESIIMWIPTINRKTLMTILPCADVAIGNLGRDAIMYNVVMEYLSVGLPIIQRGTSDPQIYPYHRATNSEEISKTLGYYLSLESNEKIDGEIGQNWFVETAINEPLEILKRQLDELNGSHNSIYLSYLNIKLIIYSMIMAMVEKPRLIFQQNLGFKKTN